MGNIFAGSEIVELGVQIEKNGRDFYNALASRSKNQKAVGIFTYLAKEEEKHIAVFQKMLEKLDAYEPPQAYADDYVAYMKALAGEHVFTQEHQGEAVAKKAASDAEAVQIGIQLEKDSIVFYEGMKKAVPEYDHKAVNELIVQEQGHLRQLVVLKEQL
ncbi:MAG TPA: ferritin family protein [Patescibacteria group bacterium]|nr:ferritin family protein [Patescibacteria group bacterium]